MEPFNLTSRLIEVENGLATLAEVIELFTHLLNNVHILTALQGGYIRSANQILKDGFIKYNHTTGIFEADYIAAAEYLVAENEEADPEI